MSFFRRYWLYLIGAAGIFAACFLLVRCVDRSMDHAVEQAHDAGAATQRTDDLTETIRRTERANNAAEDISHNRNAWLAQCRLHARNPDDCH